jgi:energy-coupling factor transporter ATP-binding protein EcfA2
MIANVLIENFKSIKHLELPLGRFNVLIGENGSGKSNLLEALAFMGAASAGKLDNEFLASRGIRVSDHKFMRSAFGARADAIHLRVKESSGKEGVFEVRSDDSNSTPYPRWVAYVHDRGFAVPVTGARSRSTDTRSNDWLGQRLAEYIKEYYGHPAPFSEQEREVFALELTTALESLKGASALTIGRFIVYSPEASALRTFEREGQILPLGIRGEGLFKLLGVLAHSKDQGPWNDLRGTLRVLDWFEDIEVPIETDTGPRNVRLRDRFIPKELGYFDQRSANEAFLFLLFYVALFVSPDTPACFAIDNLEAALNPKLCRELVRRLVSLAKKYGKQVIVTTHNPAILDGLDLGDDEQRLFVVARGRTGDTKVRRAAAPKPVGDEPPTKLSDAFLRGLLGGLPQNF